MKTSLRLKIVVSFALIVLLSMGLAVGSANRLTRKRYDDYSYVMDVNRARMLARVLGEYISDSDNLNPEDFHPDSRLFAFPLPLFPAPVDADMMPHGREDRGMMNRMMDKMSSPRMQGPIREPGVDHVVVTDLQGRVLLDTADYGHPKLDPDGLRPVTVRLQNSDAGYLYLGSMIPGEPRSGDASFFRTAGRATLLISVLIFLIAMILGLILSRHIVGPVKTLNDAASRVEDGNLGVRVPDRRKDELGDLSRGFNSMTASLERADAQRKRLIADSAHELRTPVSLIRTRIEMMEEGVYPLDGEGLAALAGESERLVHLVEELRILAELESSDNEPVMAELDLQSLMKTVLTASGPAIDRSGIRVELKGVEIGTRLAGDADQVHRLMSNLLNNALRYADTEILISCRDEGEKLVIQVEDDGPGIPVEDRENVFHRYFRVDHSRSRDSGGSGLGLAICREISHSHGGAIRAGESGRLGGALFEVRLPKNIPTVPNLVNRSGEAD